jgi:hypothetical protein
MDDLLNFLMIDRVVSSIMRMRITSSTGPSAPYTRALGPRTQETS